MTNPLPYPHREVADALASVRPLTLEAEDTRPYMTDEEAVWSNAVVALSCALSAPAGFIDRCFGPRVSRLPEALSG